jgi:putative hemolysin
MIEIFIILGLILLNGIFSMAEIALVSARKARLEAQAQKGDAQAKEALALANHPDTFLSTVQIGITLIGILTGIFSGDTVTNDVREFFRRFPSIAPYANGLATALVVVVLTYFSMVLGELLPKRIGMSNPERIAKLVAGPMRVISLATHPFIWLLSKAQRVACNGRRNQSHYQRGYRTGSHRGSRTGNHRAGVSPRRPQHHFADDAPQRYHLV